MSATAWPETIFSPSGARMIAAPEYMLSSTNIPKPIGVPSLKTSKEVPKDGPLNLLNNLFFLYELENKTIISIAINISIETIVVAYPQPTPPISGNPKYPYTNIISSGIFINAPMKTTMKTGIVRVKPSLYELNSLYNI